MSDATQDWDLLRAYVDTGSEDAFSQLIERHLNMVYSACLRQVRDAHLAEDATQATFMILARKVRKLSEGAVLSAWLYKVAHFTARNALKVQTRRSMHERKAAAMAAQYVGYDPGWCSLEPLLDEAVASLNGQDRSAIVLRFFERRSFREVGHALGASEAAAEMRVSRALEKLRTFFQRRGIVLPALALGSVLWTNSVHAAPQSLRRSVSQLATAAASDITASGQVQALAHGAMRDMAWATAKLVGLTCAGVVLALVMSFYLIQHLLSRAPARPPDRIEQATAGRPAAFTPRSDTRQQRGDWQNL